MQTDPCNAPVRLVVTKSGRRFHPGSVRPTPYASFTESFLLSPLSSMGFLHADSLEDLALTTRPLAVLSLSAELTSTDARPLVSAKAPLSHCLYIGTDSVAAKVPVSELNRAFARLRRSKMRNPRILQMTILACAYSRFVPRKNAEGTPERLPPPLPTDPSFVPTGMQVTRQRKSLRPSAGAEDR